MSVKDELATVGTLFSFSIYFFIVMIWIAAVHCVVHSWVFEVSQNCALSILISGLAVAVCLAPALFVAEKIWVEDENPEICETDRNP